jgi:ElaB/YqjD/DUF883 family membrane-anchored ribosome-binding protein
MVENGSRSPEPNKAAGGLAADAVKETAESASEAAQAANEIVQQAANSLGDALKDWIEHNPYAAVAIAFGLGWLYGRRHRPF